MLKFVYIMGFNDPQIVKIGVSCVPMERMSLVANELNIKFSDCWTYVSSIQKDPFLIENKCHKTLSKYRFGGVGPEKLYPRETFLCGIDEAKLVLENIINAYEKKYPRFNRAKWLMAKSKQKQLSWFSGNQAVEV